MDQLFMDLEKLTSISEQEDYLHIASENGDKIIRTGIFTNGLHYPSAGHNKKGTAGNRI